MKKFILLLLVLPLLAFAQAKAPAKSATYDAQILRVTDGDTVVIAAKDTEPCAQAKHSVVKLPQHLLRRL